MNKKEWLLVTIPLILVWTLDQLSKKWASGLSGILEFGYLKLVLHHNHGAMLGLFSDLPAVLRVVSLSTAGAFLLCSYALIQYLLPLKSLVLRSGMSILIGGIIGNVTDRIIYGYVVDFIVFGTNKMNSPAFNIADAVQWVGYFMIVYVILKDGELLWPENNSRKKYWINFKFQLKYCLLLTAVGLSLTLIGLVFSFTYLRVTIIELVGHNLVLVNKFLIPFFITYVIISFTFCAILFAVGRVISHRIAGPLYAFERFLVDAVEGKNLTVSNQALKLRAGDEFRHLEELADTIREKLLLQQKQRTIQVVAFEDTQSQTQTAKKENREDS